jgi:uncharacterized heparinase superfamily protein
MGVVTGWRDRLAARLAARARVAGPFVPPEPLLLGDPAAGRLLVAGRHRWGEAPVERGMRSLWDLGGPAELHGFGWLHDLAAVGDGPARALAQAWTGEWIERWGGGGGPGWTAGLAAGRVRAWALNARFLLRGESKVAAARFAEALGRQALFLAGRWAGLPAGAPRAEALASLAFAGAALPGLALLPRIGPALEAEAAHAVEPDGGLASRRPEALLDLCALLAAAAEVLAAADRPAPRLGAAVAQAAPVLRALRHADGGLARFHGGDRGTEGRLDAVLAFAGRPALGASVRPQLRMGFARLAAGRTTVIVDAAPPPRTECAQASTLAFELTSGRRPLVVGCGPGQMFGPSWARAARATASHSTLSLGGVSSARLPPGAGGGGGCFAEGPRRVIAEATPLTEGLRWELAHDGWRASHGLTHARTLRLSPDGREFEGEDLLTTLGPADDRAFMRAAAGGPPRVELRFHLHPEVVPEAAGPGIVRLALPSGEIWMFQSADAVAALEPSVHLEAGRLAPRGAWQVVLSGRALSARTRLRWRLAKDVGTPGELRDLGPRDGGEGE